GAWVTEIAAAQAEFERLFLLRNDERAAKPQEKLRAVRKQIGAVYRQVVEHIDSYTVINGEASTAAFVSRINQEITYFNEHSHRHTPVDIEHAVVASIPDQTYRGEPVVLLPEVMYNGKKLVFTRDYELSYKDNDRPGTALLIVHGKGAFKGRKQVSFNIV
ncbi:MAG: DUF6261 family protein, partial [Dysgonamonadaceae bacterium]|nr:DUF6261 family protein [Dysgonamonadaceae bacterium]